MKAWCISCRRSRVHCASVWESLVFDDLRNRKAWGFITQSKGKQIQQRKGKGEVKQAKILNTSETLMLSPQVCLCFGLSYTHGCSLKSLKSDLLENSFQDEDIQTVCSSAECPCLSQPTSCYFIIQNDELNYRGAQWVFHSRPAPEILILSWTGLQGTLLH